MTTTPWCLSAAASVDRPHHRCLTTNLEARIHLFVPLKRHLTRQKSHFMKSFHCFQVASWRLTDIVCKPTKQQRPNTEIIPGLDTTVEFFVWRREIKSCYVLHSCSGFHVSSYLLLHKRFTSSLEQNANLIMKLWGVQPYPQTLNLTSAVKS